MTKKILSLLTIFLTLNTAVAFGDQPTKDNNSIDNASVNVADELSNVIDKIKQNNTKKQPVVEITDKDRKNAKKLCEKDGKHVYDGTRCNEKTDTTQADDTKQFRADSEKLVAAFKTTVAKLNAKSE